MPKDTSVSKAFAVTFVVLTASVIGGIVTMIILYNTEISGMNPTPRPTFQSTTEGPPPDRRLPRNLLPDRYRVFLQPHLYTRIIEEVNVTSPNQTELFTGNSTVYFHCVRSTSTIYLHSLDLTVSRPRVTNEDTNKRIQVSGVFHDSVENDILEVTLNEALQAGGNYSLFLDFSGEMASNMDGIYMSTYVEGVPAHEDDTNNNRYLAATNVEPTQARRVFPCFDEPDMKAEFVVTIIHRTDTVALGNAEESASSILDAEWGFTHFHPTPKMSTYLFAFTVSEFTSWTPSEHERVKIKTYARPEAIAAGHAQYAASITGKILTFYEKRFGIDYVQKEFDQIALPDLLPLAMENWGLVTYQQGSVLYEEGVSSPLDKEIIATIIAHELAHQWFGNLVTMKWWNQVWLNEGFATYNSYMAVDEVEPTFRLKDTHIMNNLHEAFEQDSLASSHPLSPPQDDIFGNEIFEMFDSITYCKGAAVLTMLADVIDERVFNQGIKMYLQDFKYENTDQEDLWESLQKVVDQDGGHTKVATVMNTWTNQIGYPVITINTSNGELYQKHFLFNASSESSLWWHVPIRVMSNSSQASIQWLDSPHTVKKEEFISKSGEWILANVNCTGYYRVNYDLDNWDRLLTQLETNPHRIPQINRGQLVDDAFNLARAKLVDVTLALNATRFLRNERALIPWELTVKNLQYFVHMFDRSEVYGPMQAYLRQQVTGLYNFFRNYTDHSAVPEDHSLQHNQILAIQVACSNGLPECLTMATEMFDNWMNSNTTNRIHPNLRSVIYCQALAAGGGKEWEFAWKKFQSCSDTSEKEQLREALACTKKIWLLNRYLKYTLDPDKIRLMDVASVIGSIANNVAGQALAWNFIRAHWDYVSMGNTGALIEGVTSRFSTPFELLELQRFEVDTALNSASWAVDQALEQTRVNIQWVGENKDIVLEWFENETA